jgi:hypothetical protein
MFFFLLRMAFWLSVVLILLPSGASQSPPPANDVGASQAISAASATVQDLRGFCARQPDACTVGSQVAVALGYKAQAGAKMLYDFLTDSLAPHDTGTVGHGAAPHGGIVKTATDKITADRASQNTLTPADLAATWRGPPVRKDPKHAV